MLRYDKSTMMLKELYSNNVPLFMPAASMYLHWADEGVNVLLQRVRIGGRGITQWSSTARDASLQLGICEWRG